jgi:AbrB family looped-hinge helix DNA binding protein
MAKTLALDKAGRVVLPKPVRDDLQLQPGDLLEVESSEQEIILRPLRGGLPLRKKQGIWVFRAGEPLRAEAVSRVIKEVRRERERSNTGELRRKDGKPERKR